jgi:hypothetical protein
VLTQQKIFEDLIYFHGCPVVWIGSWIGSLS